LLACSVFL